MPHSSRLFLDYLTEFSKVKDFYPHPPAPRDWLSAAARAVPTNPSRRLAVADVLERQNRGWGASAETLTNIARLRDGAAAVVTGQQVGLLGGPVFSLYKAISAIRLAEQATASGQPCVPVFWLASEDHDFDEVNQAGLPGEDSQLIRLRLEAPPPIADSPVSAYKLQGEITGVVERARSSVSGTAGFDPEIWEAFRKAYRPGETLPSAYARFFTSIFATYGLVILDPSDADLHRIAAPIYRKAIADAPALTQALLTRGKALEHAGYHAQVKVTPASTQLFVMEAGARLPLHQADAGFIGCDQKFSREQLLTRAEQHPEDFSASALLRPIVQDFLLPTIAYIGGPAEIAYFAQSAVLYQALLGRVTPILPRFSATIIEPGIERLLRRYKLNVADLFTGAEEVRELIAARSLPPHLDAAFTEVRAHLEESLERLQGPLGELDQTLVASSATAASKIRYQVGKLHSRAARAMLRRGSEIGRQAGRLSAALYPNRNLQEREVAGIYFLARYGRGFVQQIYEATAQDCVGHAVLHLADS